MTFSQIQLHLSLRLLRFQKICLCRQYVHGQVFCALARHRWWCSRDILHRQRLPDLLSQKLLFKWLGDKVSAAMFTALDGSNLCAVRREHHDGKSSSGLLEVLANLFADVIASHARHLDVQKDDIGQQTVVRHVPFQPLQCARPIHAAHYLVVFTQAGSNDLLVDFAVIHRQDQRSLTPWRRSFCVFHFGAWKCLRDVMDGGRHRLNFLTKLIIKTSEGDNKA
mmetsp:Transcript_22434/g.53420  ORF Transcript_22434/g.53420 Transcript_22434/m.53420 type:complete len:223 (+) Transcript_22434:430-1098(+)